MSVEAAIVRFVVEGASAVGTATDKVQADLTAVERAGARARDASAAAEGAAQRADAASRALAAGISSTLGRLASAAQFAERLAKAAGQGEETRLGRGVDLFGKGLAGAASGAALGSVAGPVGTVLGAVVGGGAALVSGLDEQQKRMDERQRAAEKRADDAAFRDLEGALLQQAGLAKLDGALTAGELREVR